MPLELRRRGMDTRQRVPNQKQRLQQGDFVLTAVAQGELMDWLQKLNPHRRSITAPGRHVLKLPSQSFACVISTFAAPVLAGLTALKI